jgi:hypothetical protein
MLFRASKSARARCTSSRAALDTSPHAEIVMDQASAPMAHGWHARGLKRIGVGFALIFTKAWSEITKSRDVVAGVQCCVLLLCSNSTFAARCLSQSSSQRFSSGLDHSSREMAGNGCASPICFSRRSNSNVSSNVRPIRTRFPSPSSTKSSSVMSRKRAATERKSNASSILRIIAQVTNWTLASE